MTLDGPTDIFLPDPEATAALGAAVARRLEIGEAVLLTGPLGAGKSALARAAVQARLADDGRDEEVPSPTYTLVQVYPTAVGEIWHADLYRLRDPEEAAELGLADAFADAVCLIEWPDRLGPYTPRRALVATLGFPDGGDGRTLRLTPRGEGWGAAIAAAQGAA